MTSWKPKSVGVDLRSFLIKKPGPTSKKAKGLKKGTGGIDSSGLAVSEAIEEIEQYANATEEDNSEVEPRYVQGAHLVFRRMVEVGSIEELWVYKIDKRDPTKHIEVERAILDATDISPETHASEDGSQRAYTWVAGDAKMMHITGLL